ncbi:MAG: DNA gyrase subunit A, partial [Cyanobacteria bacterium REEB65]|nr:DNA gyrase subunit A [Cyanobacteria bacterium REEB65]
RREDLIPDEEMAVFITDQGYLKRLAVDTFERQGRGGKGITGMGHREGDFVRHFFVGSAHQPVLFFTNKGLAYSLKIYELPEASRTAKGSNIANLLPLTEGEAVTSVVPVPKGFGEDQFLLMLTRMGTIKKTELAAFSNIRRSGIIAIALDDGDELGWVAHTGGGSSVLIATQEGMAIHFPEDELRPLGRPARGVRAISLRPGDSVVGMAIAQNDADLLTVTTDGYGKRTPISEYRPQSRGGLGLINIKLNVNRNGKVANILVVRDPDEIVIVTTNGIVIRQKAADIGRYSRMAQGVRLQRLGEDDRVAGVAMLVAEDEE